MTSGNAARKHLEKRLKRLRPLRAELTRPPRGWLRAVRESLGMTGAQLAQRLKVSQPRIFALEKAEARGAVTIASLERAAAALQCTLVYALVPNQPLDKLLEERARAIAAKQVARVDHSMRLENQAVDAATLEQERKRLAEALVRDHPRRLWNKF
jgi:predicted DNA-binding mobile mystery protein A